MDQETYETFVAGCLEERAELVAYLEHLKSGTSHVGGGPTDPYCLGRTEAEIGRLEAEIAGIDSAIAEFAPAHP